MDRFIVISGCSGAGKSSLLAELGRRGCAVVEEPGRRIVEQELAGDGAALPWIDGAAFARRAVELALADRSEAAACDGLVFLTGG
jgi:predicted ATPase